MKWLVYLYRWTLSPLIGSCCRFYPSCSEYALEVLKSQGNIRGTWLILKRLAKCHPWNPGGYDPPP